MEATPVLCGCWMAELKKWGLDWCYRGCRNTTMSEKMCFLTWNLRTALSVGLKQSLTARADGLVWVHVLRTSSLTNGHGLDTALMRGCSSCLESYWGWRSKHMLARLWLGMHEFRVILNCRGAMRYICGSVGNGEGGLRLCCQGQRWSRTGGLGFLVTRGSRIRRAAAWAWGWGTNTDWHPGSEGWVVKRVRALNHGTGFCWITQRKRRCRARHLEERDRWTKNSKMKTEKGGTSSQSQNQTISHRALSAPFWELMADAKQGFTCKIANSLYSFSITDH